MKRAETSLRDAVFTASGVLALTVMAATTGACGRGGPAPEGSGGTVAGPPTAEELANATYRGIFDDSITLIGGRWEGESYVEGGASRPTAGLVDHFAISGDLDGDGDAETAVLLWASTGGSGNLLFLAVVARDDGMNRNVDTTLIGDRVQVRSGGIDDGLITLRIVRAGAEDAACCPTQNARVSWVLSEGKLMVAADEITGALSLADLEGPEWVLLELGRNQHVPDSPEITLSFLQNKVSGNAGCNSYFAGVSGPVPGGLEFTGMGATRMACPDEVMDIERRYLKTLAGASRYSFLAGRLVLSCETDEGPVALIFSARSRG